MAIEKIIQIILENDSQANTKIIESTYQFLKKEIQDIPFAEKNRIYNHSLDVAENIAAHSGHIEFTCAGLLFDLVQHKKPDIYFKIKKELNENIELLAKSYEFARQKLGDQEQFLRHSFQTALKLASVKSSTPALCTALLHELPHRAQTTLTEIEKNSNKEISGLIEKFEKIHHLKVPDNKEFIANLKEMVIAMAQDLRVILIKMCSNIDRLTTRELTTPEKLHDIARESMDILAPIADLLGIWELRWPLEDLSFKILQPEEYAKISERFRVDEKKNREKYIKKTKNILSKAAAEAKISCRIDGRFKHFYSIYQKMKIKNKFFSDIGDVFALRVVVNSVDECYRMLGIIHHLWKPKQKRIKDYIATPKSNNYQSLHTTVFGLNGRPTEFQIRTKEMDDEASYGIAAHWFYKNTQKKAPDWIQELLLKQQNLQDDEEFFSTFSSEILNNRIYTYTPKGDVISLPAGATAVDFAYHIHSELGNKCTGAIVNDIPAPLDRALSTNDVVQILTNREQLGPNSEWLDFVKTSLAKKQIENAKKSTPVARSFRL
jgi:GTP pyrophosphokinase